MGSVVTRTLSRVTPMWRLLPTGCEQRILGHFEEFYSAGATRCTWGVTFRVEEYAKFQFSSVQFSSINSSTYTMVSEVVPVGLLKEVFSLHTKTVLWRLRTSANVPEDLFQTIGAATHRHREGSVGPKTDILMECGIQAYTPARAYLLCVFNEIIGFCRQFLRRLFIQV